MCCAYESGQVSRFQTTSDGVTLIRLLLAVMLSASIVSRASAELLVLVDVSDQTMIVSHEGKHLVTWSVSTGLPGKLTPTGAFQPIRMHEKWLSRKYDGVAMPSSIFFHNGYAIHGTLETRSLGRPASRGCVRLHPENAKLLFELVKKEGMSRTVIIIQD